MKYSTYRLRVIKLSWAFLSRSWKCFHDTWRYSIWKIVVKLETHYIINLSVHFVWCDENLKSLNQFSMYIFFSENLSLEPGEPVPPGLEERIIINCAIQPTLDSCKSALIGLEYVVELTDSSTFDKEYYYYCLLCEKTGSERNMLIHLTSIYHNLKYLVSVVLFTLLNDLLNITRLIHSPPITVL